MKDTNIRNINLHANTISQKQKHKDIDKKIIYHTNTQNQTLIKYNINTQKDRHILTHTQTTTFKQKQHTIIIYIIHTHSNQNHKHPYTETHAYTHV